MTALCCRRITAVNKGQARLSPLGVQPGSSVQRGACAMNKRDTILVVDDMEVNRAILGSLFEGEYNLLEAENGRQAMVLLEEYHSQIAIVLLDLIMPVMDGYQVMDALRRRGLLQEFPVIVITAEDSAENEMRAFDLGASDIVMKPFEPHVVKRRVKNTVELNLRKLNQQELIRQQATKLRESNTVMVDALSSIIEYRSMETGQHIQRIRLFAQLLLQDVARCYPEFGLDEYKINMIASASSMHDIGKIAIPDSILNKPGRLTPEEFEVMKSHTTKGCEMLARLDRMSDREYLQYAYNICRYHHERWDGRGYPDGLKNDNIPICAQVVGIADCYDALTTDRVYKKAIPSEQALNMVLNGECGAFSPKLLECLKNVRGTFARLSEEYADGRRPVAEAVKPAPPVLVQQDDMLDTLQAGQKKYFTLLRYINATVMEIDQAGGVYHVVYLSSADFEQLKSGNSFAEAMRNFIQEAVHPEERENALQFAGQGLQGFFADGVLQQSRRFRVYSRQMQSYRWVRATLLRIELRNPYDKKALLIWQEEREDARASSTCAASDERVLLGGMLGGMQLCRNDRYYTMDTVSYGLQSLLGYTAEEIAQQHQNRLINLVHPQDRQMVRQQLAEQLQDGSMAELECRLTDKHGDSVWVLNKAQIMRDPDGQESLLCALIDITQSKKAQEELRLTLERHKIIMEQANDVIFEWDMHSDTVVYSSNWQEKFGYQPLTEQVSKRIVQVSHVHPEDLAGFGKLIENMRAGVPVAELEFRLADGEGRYRWCKVRAVSQFDDMGTPVKAVGILMDIDRQKREYQVLKKEVERDGLTQLYNKNSGRRLIERRLEKSSGQSAMMIIDVDNFKQVNDVYGHMFGDAVLQQIAGCLQRIFLRDDIIVRIGGDEFLIFMADTPDEEAVHRRAESIRQDIRQLQSQLYHDIQWTPSCSMGAALYPQHGRDYETLFRNSDYALYEAKARGKDGHVLFDPAQAASVSYTHAAQTSTRIESGEAPEIALNRLIVQAFQKLYEAGNVEKAAEAILEMVGRQFNVSRVYIFEDAQDDTHFSNTFEWCNEGVAPQKEKLQRCNYEALGGRHTYLQLFGGNSVFFCQDISILPVKYRELLRTRGVGSTLQCQIQENGNVRGIVGFEDCKPRRVWTHNQVGILTFLAKLLTVFLLKQRAQDQVMETLQNLYVVLDNQSTWVYVVDPQTYALYYVNQKILLAAPHAREGQRCYMALFGRDTPCVDCPIRQGICCVEMYNPTLEAWAMVSASPIRWDRKDVYLVSCQDVTYYKKKLQDLPQARPDQAPPVRDAGDAGR